MARVLFGEYNPAGKLPITFYKNSEQLPDFKDYSMKGRTYRYMNDALFPFGYGLSYTSFRIGDATLSNSILKKGEKITLKVPVSNVGKKDGTEIVQVYVKDPADTEGPLKSLKAFERVEVKAGKTAEAVLRWIAETSNSSMLPPIPSVPRQESMKFITAAVRLIRI